MLTSAEFDKNSKYHCFNCPLYVPNGKELGQGECFGNFPAVFIIGPGKTMSVVPPVKANFWCGSHPEVKRALAKEAFEARESERDA